jgi:hypothetical protein
LNHAFELRKNQPAHDTSDVHEAENTTTLHNAVSTILTCSWFAMSMTLGRAGKLGWLWYQPTTRMLYSSLITSVTCSSVCVRGGGGTKTGGWVGGV